MNRLLCLSLIAALAGGCSRQTPQEAPAKKSPPPDAIAVGVEKKGPAKKDPPIDPPKEFTNSIGMKFVWIPPGTFLMGSPMEEEGRRDNETQHKVRLTKEFYMGVHVVTQEQWKIVMGNDSIHHVDGENQPVQWVSWDDSQAFIAKLSEKEGRAYRLPTEAEWEYACRAGTTTPFHFGATISTDLANYNGDFTFGKQPKGVFRGKTTPVGSFRANAFGLYDMHGNASQWCQDWLADYPQGEAVDPLALSPMRGLDRVMRGGTWNQPPGHCRSAWRTGIGGDVAWVGSGFRVVSSLP